MNELLDRARSLYLAWCIRRLTDQEADSTEILKVGDSLIEFHKLDIAREKIAAAREVALRRAHAGNSRNQKSYDPRAPYGRKIDGRPITHGEFKVLYDQHLRDTYGVSLPPDLAPTDSERRSLSTLDESSLPADAAHTLHRADDEHDPRATRDSPSLSSHHPDIPA